MKKVPSILWTATEAAAVTGGSSYAPWAATGVCLRAQDVKPGDLFIASEGERLDVAYKNGAVAAVVSQNDECGECPMPLLRVANPYEALRDLARAARFRTHATVLSVQGRDARAAVAKMFAHLGHLHESGKMLSHGMAMMPEDYDFGIFPLAPSVRPDIAIISDGNAEMRDGLFESMPRNATVILNRDCPQYFDMIARAKTAGLTRILSFGAQAGADAWMVEKITAANGTRVTMQILGETHTLNVDESESLAVLPAALLAAKICGRDVHALTRLMKPCQTLRRQIEGFSISLFDAVPRVCQKRTEQAVFRIQNLIDFGYGRQTAILDNISFPESHSDGRENGLAIPRKIANLECVYAGRKITGVRNAHEAIKSVHARGNLEAISTDVLAPGDFIVFEQPHDRLKASFSEALRLNSWKQRPQATSYVV